MSHVLDWRGSALASLRAARAWPAKRASAHSLDVLMLAPTGFFSDYGCHVRIFGQAKALQERGHRIRVLTYSTGRNLPGLDIIRVPRLPWGAKYKMGSSWHKPPFDVLLLLRAYLAGRRSPPDVIHAFLHEGAFIGHLLARLWNVPLVFDYQGSLTGEMVDHGFLRPNGALFGVLGRLERHIHNLPDALVTSSGHAAALLRHFDCRCPVVKTIPDSVDGSEFRRPPAEESAALRARLGLPAGRRIVGYLGKLAGYQGTDLLLESAARLCEVRPDTHFLIMGYPGVESYRRKAHEMGLQGRVTFTGRVPYEHAGDYLALADIAVAPKLSTTESNGKLLNYMALGLPTVAFDTPVAREYLGDLGFYAGPGADGLAAAIERALDLPDPVPLGRLLRERAVRRYSWQEAADRIDSVYSRVLREYQRRVAVTTRESC